MPVDRGPVDQTASDKVQLTTCRQVLDLPRSHAKPLGGFVNSHEVHDG